jgi:hypothetical protein
MRRRRTSSGVPKAEPIFKVTPSMRRKVEDLALWLSVGDRRRMKGATQAVIDLLRVAAEMPRPVRSPYQAIRNRLVPPGRG